ncbi:hypothetical protein ACQF36_44130 [Streptomyces sp. Marseille-Q5077]|uniref:hypothetical protein n=1 Tax=Streptomyces sp. Marseille-Q5077 TaxID=3418995 RepID=UPI003D046621
MLTEAFAALAAAGGAAVVQAAGTSAWEGFRQTAARWFGRGNDERERAELERLDRSAAELSAVGDSEADRVRIRQEAMWQARFEQALELLTEVEREQAADQLRALLASHAPAGGVSTGDGSLAVGGSVEIRADRGAVAGGVIHGGVSMGTPPQPGPELS